MQKNKNDQCLDSIRISLKIVYHKGNTDGIATYCNNNVHICMYLKVQRNLRLQENL